MRVSRSNVCGNNEHLRNVKEMGKKSFMEWQYFFGRIPVAGSIPVFQDAVQGVLRFSGLCRVRYEWLSK